MIAASDTAAADAVGCFNSRLWRPNIINTKSDRLCALNSKLLAIGRTEEEEEKTNAEYAEKLLLLPVLTCLFCLAVFVDVVVVVVVVVIVVVVDDDDDDDDDAGADGVVVAQMERNKEEEKLGKTTKLSKRLEAKRLSLK